MNNISVIGSGTMGNGIAHIFALNGYQVSLTDISEEVLNKGLETISRNLDRQVKKEIIQESQKKQVLQNISIFVHHRVAGH